MARGFGLDKFTVTIIAILLLFALGWDFISRNPTVIVIGILAWAVGGRK